MKTSFRRLRELTIHRQSGDDYHRRDLQSISQLSELQASQDLEDMKNCYDSLLAAAAATTNVVYEFSVSLGEYGSCLLEKTSLNDDEESGKVLLKLGKLQFELQKGLDTYRSHLSRTITAPSNSLLNELRTVEEMKQVCDDKRSIYESMLAKQKEKGRKSGKGERSLLQQQLQEAREHYEVAATLFIFRLKSLKQGQSRSLLTQAARHHAAQMHLFKKALKAIEAVEPYVKFVAEQYHIDYQLNELEDDDTFVVDDDDDEDDSDDMKDDGELSFEYGQNDPSSIILHPMELDQVDVIFPKIAASDTLKKNSSRRIPRESYPSSGNIKSYTQSAPLFADKKPNHLSGPVMRQTSTRNRKLETYVLPTPGDPKTSSISPKKFTPFPSVLNSNSQKLWHSSPLGVKQHTETIDKNTSPTPLPPPRGAESLLFSQFDPFITSSSKKIKRQAFSGPLINKPKSNLQISTERPNLYSGPLLRNPLSSPPKVSRVSFPPPTSSPKINELHELPRPPLAISKRPSQFVVGYSGPLVSRRERDPSGRNNESTTASPLPRPPLPKGLPRSSSIPTSGGSMLIPRHEKFKDSRNPEKMDEEDEVMSPPLRPLSFSNIRIIPTD